MRAMRMAIDLFKRRYVLVGAVVLISAVAVFGDKGLLDVYRLRKELNGMLKVNAPIEAENRALEHEIELLKSDKRYIEYVAKKELGLIGRNEIVYKIAAPETAAPTPTADARPR